MKLLNFATFEAGPAWIDERLARPDRAPLGPVDGFEYDSLRSNAAAYGYMGHLQAIGDIPDKGNRDQHIFRFFAKMHGVGVGQERAHALYDEFLQTTGGAAPDGWPNDAKSWDKVRRIWRRVTADNAPGSELAPLSLTAPIGAAEPTGEVVEDRWHPVRMHEMIAAPPVEFYDDAKTIPHYLDGGVAMTYGPGGHGKTNVWISRCFELWETHPKLKIVIASGEGAQGLGARFRAQCEARNVEPYAYHDCFLGCNVPLVANVDDMKDFANMLAAQDMTPDILLIDTWSTALAGLDEDHKAAALLTNTGTVGRLARGLKCLIVVIHHTGKDKKGHRGAVGFAWNVDMVNLVEAPTDTNQVALEWHVERMKDGAGGHSLYYAIEYRNGVPVPMRTSLAGFTLLTGDMKWEGKDASGAIGGALTTLARPVSAEHLMMQLHPRGNMDVEDWQARCATLGRKLNKAARDGLDSIKHLWEEGPSATGGSGGALVWRTPPAAA